MIFAYEGLDGVRRTTELIFSPAPEIVSADGARFTLDLGHRESVSIHVTIIPNGDHIDASFGEQFDTLAASYRDWISSCTRVFTSNDFVNAMLERSLTDLRMLRVEDGDGGFIAAGTPWFSSLFGRDSLIPSSPILLLQRHTFGGFGLRQNGSSTIQRRLLGGVPSAVPVHDGHRPNGLPISERGPSTAIRRRCGHSVPAHRPTYRVGGNRA